MDDQLEKYERLTDKQRECLELVVRRKSSKEIARILNISKPAVDQRITNARNILGAANRDEAAIMFAELSSTYDRVICDPMGVPTRAFFPQDLLREVGTSSGLTLDEAVAPYGSLTEEKTEWRARLLELLSSDKGFAKRLMLILGMSVGLMAAVLIGLSLAQTLSDLLKTS